MCMSPKTTLQEITEVTQQIRRTEIMGDFNCHHSFWEDKKTIITEQN